MEEELLLPPLCKVEFLQTHKGVPKLGNLKKL